MYHKTKVDLVMVYTYTRKIMDTSRMTNVADLFKRYI